MSTGNCQRCGDENAQGRGVRQRDPHGVKPTGRKDVRDGGSASQKYKAEGADSFGDGPTRE